MSEEFKRMQTLMRGIDLSILVVGIGTLISGMVGVSNILFVSIRERAQEFGIRRALGATARSILLMVMSEALILSLFSGGLGLLSALAVMAVARSIGVDSDFFKHPQVDATAVGVSDGITIKLVSGIAVGEKVAIVASPHPTPH